MPQSESNDLSWPVGTRATLTRTVTQEMVVGFADVTGDDNPVHLDANYAASTPFGYPIAHGMLCGSLFSAIFGSKMPGHGTIYLEQTLKFKAPVYIGDTLTAVVEVSEYLKPTVARCMTTCHNQDGVVVIEGQAIIKVPV